MPLTLIQSDGLVRGGCSAVGAAEASGDPEVCNLRLVRGSTVILRPSPSCHSGVRRIASTPRNLCSALRALSHLAGFLHMHIKMALVPTRSSRLLTEPNALTLQGRMPTQDSKRHPSLQGALHTRLRFLWALFARGTVIGSPWSSQDEEVGPRCPAGAGPSPPWPRTGPTTSGGSLNAAPLS